MKLCSSEDVMAPYRVGLGDDLHRLWFRLRRHLWGEAWAIVKFMAHSSRRRSWWGLWQSENPDLCPRARRGLTAAAARRRMERDARRAIGNGAT